MIHNTAIIDPKAKISSNVSIGAFTVIGPNVEIGENTIIQSHVSIIGHTIIGNDNRFFPFSSINIPQDLKYKIRKVVSKPLNALCFLHLGISGYRTLSI